MESPNEGRRRRLIEARNELAAVRETAPLSAVAASLFDAFDAKLAATDIPALADRLWTEKHAAKAVVFGDKYLNFGKRILQNLERAERLGLVGAEPKEILDLGAGLGMFCWVCEQLGHHAVALEPDGHAEKPKKLEMPALFEFIGVPRAAEMIKWQRPLPKIGELDRRFDLVTAFAVKFNSTWLSADSPTPTFWKTDDYLFLLDDLRENFLNPFGKVVLHLQEGGALTPPSLRNYYAALDEMLEPFAVTRDPIVGITLDLFRDEARTQARSISLPVPAEDELFTLTTSVADAHQSKWAKRHQLWSERNAS